MIWWGNTFLAGTAGSHLSELGTGWLVPVFLMLMAVVLLPLTGWRRIIFWVVTGSAILAYAKWLAAYLELAKPV